MPTLEDWFHVSFDDERVRIWIDPEEAEHWEQSFAWSEVFSICFETTDLFESDDIYVFTTQRPESFVIPMDGDGAVELWGAILDRGLFDAKLAIEIATSAELGRFFWPPVGKTGQTPDDDQLV